MSPSSRKKKKEKKSILKILVEKYILKKEKELVINVEIHNLK
jgi:hypothetical protein